MIVASVEADLEDWDAIADGDWPTLVVGNGLSINLWSDFRYASLYDKARLAPEAEQIFTELSTTNFETVLECIHHVRLVLGALGRQTRSVNGMYDEVRDALFAAVTDAHVDWNDFPAPTHEHIALIMNDHKSVFTTNYDLCLYWSHIYNRALVDIVDFFWSGNQFDRANADVWRSSTTPIYYLHGAVHLWQDDLDNGKWTNADGGSLLALASNYSATTSRQPLFVSEGTSKAKLRTIRRSPYLSFCLEALKDDDRNTVTFGHSLSGQTSTSSRRSRLAPRARWLSPSIRCRTRRTSSRRRCESRRRWAGGTRSTSMTRPRTR